MHFGSNVKIYRVWVKRRQENTSMMSKNLAEKFGLFPDEKSCSSGGENQVSSTLLQDGQSLSQSEDTSAVDKPKVSRTRFSIYQKVALENSFLSSLYLTGKERDALAFKLGLSPLIVQTWFKNRRFKWRKEVKMANGTRPEPGMIPSPIAAPPFHFPSPPPLTTWEPSARPELQQHLWEGSVCSCCPSSAPRMFRNSSNTHW